MIRFGIIGCGYIGNRHAKHITENQEAQLVAAYDVKPESRNVFQKNYNLPATDSLEDLLKRDDLDIISICTPNGNHFPSALAALEAGKNVLIEKPMTLHKDDAEQLIYTGLKNNKQIFVVKQNRFNPPVQHVKSLMQDGRLGEVYFVIVNCYWNRNKEYYIKSDWKGKRLEDGGTLFTQFSHFVDIAYYLFGDV
ncbi:MAG: Gfo/Idh/MocA family oxidoreductase, partial [Bacteroidota bacterium]